MKIEREEIKEEKYKYVDKTICDLCHTKYEGDNWGINSSYDSLETKIHLRTGSNYPEGFDHDYLECDICPDCFTLKLVPWLESQGVKMRKRNFNY